MFSRGSGTFFANLAGIFFLGFLLVGRYPFLFVSLFSSRGSQGLRKVRLALPNYRYGLSFSVYVSIP